MNEKMIKYCFQNICRTCATVYDSLHDVPDLKKKYYYEFLQAFGNIIINYGFQIPNKLCSPCLDKLYTFIDFRTQVQNANVYFQETLNRLREEEEKRSIHLGDSDIDDKSGIVPCAQYDSYDDTSDEKPLQEIKNENANLTITPLHSCSNCLTSFHSSEHLTQHKTTHRSGDVRCLYCAKRFLHSREIKPHLQEKHPKLKYKCGYCDTECDHERILQLHMGTHLYEKPQEIHLNKSDNDDKLKSGSSSDELFQTKRNKSKIKCSKRKIERKIKCRKRPAVNYMHTCRRCDTYFHTFEHLERHNEKHGTATSEERRTCRYCNNVFMHMRHIAPHIRKHHSKDIKYQCGYCDVQFDTHRLLQFHIGIHLDNDTKETDNKELKTFGENSTVSEFAIIRESELLNNETESTSSIICAVCGGSATFNDLETLHKHMTDEHNVTGNILPNGRIATSTFLESCEDRLYNCGKCGKGFPSSCAMKRHETTHDPDKPFYCNFGTCRWEFSTEEELSLHAIVNHTGELGCPVCFKQFKDKRTMQKHMVSHRNKDRFKCKFCDKGFNYRLHLRNHESTHTTDTPYLCPQCGKGFRIKENYRQHTLRHNKQRPHKCKLCPKSFLMPCHLKQHLKTHSEQCDVLCQTCGVQLRSQGELTKHLRVHRQNQLPEQDSRYCCTFCMRYFNRKSAFDFHMKSHKSGARVHQCDNCPWMFTSPALLREHVANRHSNKVLKRRMGIFSNLPQCGAGTNTTRNMSEEDNHTSVTSNVAGAFASVATSVANVPIN